MSGGWGQRARGGLRGRTLSGTCRRGSRAAGMLLLRAPIRGSRAFHEEAMGSEEVIKGTTSPINTLVIRTS